MTNSRHIGRLGRGSRLAAVLLCALCIAPVRANAQPAAPAPASSSPLAAYYKALEGAGLLDVNTGDKSSLKRELAAAEALLQGGAPVEAAVALYAIVESPRYEPFHDFVEYQNAEYDLGVALAVMGAPNSAQDILVRVLARGTDATYWGPAHRRMIDLALETRDHARVLARLEATNPANAAIPPSAAGERAYLRARIAYHAGHFADADATFGTINPKSRLYASSLYLRGVIGARQGKYRQAAAALCQAASSADSSALAFVVDDRYYTVKDLARLGLARIAHEQGEYDDAYYHYFQIPTDSARLPEALFEAAWSMYQQRDLKSARDLVREFLHQFPTSPLVPEAKLLAGYVELADCKFDDAHGAYEKLVNELTPVVADLDTLRHDPNRRRELFARAMVSWRQLGTAGRATWSTTPVASTDADAVVLSLLDLDPTYVRLHESVDGMTSTAGSAPGVVRTWEGLARQMRSTHVEAVSKERSPQAENLSDAESLTRDLDGLAEEAHRSRVELDRARRAGTIAADAAAEEDARLSNLEGRIQDAAARSVDLAGAASKNVAADAPPTLRPLIAEDVRAAASLAAAAGAMSRKLDQAADALAQAALERLYTNTRRVLDKARLGMIDSVIGQKRSLDIDVQDLAAGRFPAELRGRLWSKSMIGDDEEFWPVEDEYWADEYKGWR